GIELNKADTALDEPPCHETVAPEFIRWLLSHAIGFERLSRLLREIDRFGCLGLHPIGKLIRRNAGRQLLTTRTGIEMFLIQSRQQIELLALRLAFEFFRPAQVQDRASCRAKQRPLEAGGHEAARPVWLAADRSAPLVKHHDIAGETLILR